MYNQTQLVRLGWDDYARETKAERNIWPEYSIIKLFSDSLPKGSKILDVGCGSGKPITEYFVNAGHVVTGIDISPKQAEKAKTHLPQAEFIVADMQSYNFPDNHYQGIVCLHSLIHTERVHHGRVLKNLYHALKPGGLMLISVNRQPREEVSFLTRDINMFYSHFDQFETIKQIISSGLSIIHKSQVNISAKNYTYLIAKKEGGLASAVAATTVYSSEG